MASSQHLGRGRVWGTSSFTATMFFWAAPTCWVLQTSATRVVLHNRNTASHTSSSPNHKPEQSHAFSRSVPSRLTSSGFSEAFRLGRTNGSFPYWVNSSQLTRGEARKNRKNMNQLRRISLECCLRGFTCELIRHSSPASVLLLPRRCPRWICLSRFCRQTRGGCSRPEQ